MNLSNNGDVMSAPSKVYDTQLVRIRPEDWLAATSGGNRLAGVRCDAMDTDPHMRVEGVSVYNSRDVEDVLPKSRVRGNPEVRFCEVDHNNLGANILIGGAL